MAESSAGTFEILALEFSRVLEPLSGRLHHEAALGLFAELGLYIRHDELSPSVRTAIDHCHTIAHQLPTKINELTQAISDDNTDKIISSGHALIQHISQTLAAVRTLHTELNNLPSITTASLEELREFTEHFLERLLDMLISDYVETYYPLLFNFFFLLGVIEKKWFNEDSTDSFIPSFERKTIYYNRFSKLFNNPGQLAKEIYNWGEATFDGNLLIERLSDLLECLNVPVFRMLLEDTTKRTALEIFLCSVQKTNDAEPPGVEAIMTTGVSDGFSMTIPAFTNWDFQLAFSSALSASAGLQLLPPARINVVSSAAVNGDFLFKLVRKSAGGNPFTIVGLTGSSGIFAKQVSLGLLSSFKWNTTLGKAEGELGFEGEVTDGRVKISTEGSD